MDAFAPCNLLQFARQLGCDSARDHQRGFTRHAARQLKGGRDVFVLQGDDGQISLDLSQVSQRAARLDVHELQGSGEALGAQGFNQGLRLCRLRIGFIQATGKYNDGSYSNLQNPTHTFTYDNVFNVTLTASSIYGNGTPITHDYEVDTPVPVASFTGTPLIGATPLTVIFTDTSSNIPTSWSWNFGDGSPTNNTHQNPIHTYTVAGIYTVTLTASNAGGTSPIYTRNNYISVYDMPVADFTIYPSHGPIPLTVNFTDSTTSSPTSWSWDFGDGDSTNSTQQNPIHTYTNIGNYTVSLTATNLIGSDTETKSNIIETAILPVASFTWIPQTGLNPFVVYTDTSTNTPTSWYWYFGDSNTSTLQSPTHTYPLVGTYTVSLTVTNVAGSTIQTQAVTIPPYTYAPVVGPSWTYNFNSTGAYNYDLVNSTYMNDWMYYLMVTNNTNVYNESEMASWTYNFNSQGGNYQMDIVNSSGLREWMYYMVITNNSASGNPWDFPVIGFFTGIFTPFTTAFSGVGVGSGNIVFLILFGIFIMMVWRQSGKVTIPAIIAVITASGWAMLMPESAFPWVQLLLTFAIVAQVLGWIAKE